ncbi:hypothetical protein EJB05_32852, partial [Eragrostis curvula]
MPIWGNASKSGRVSKIGLQRFSRNTWVSAPLSPEKWPRRCPMDESYLLLPFYMNIKDIRMDLHSQKTC